MTRLDHPVLGPLSYLSGEGGWVGALGADEIWIAGDDDGLDPECEELALGELADLPGLRGRLEAFLAAARSPYLDQWARRSWTLNSLVVDRDEGGPRFRAMYLLDGDDYGDWRLTVRGGEPVELIRR
jgi:hypothetical protein